MAAAQERATAQDLRKEAEANTAKAAKYTGDLKAAAEALASAQLKEAEAREALAAALEANDSPKIQTASTVTIPELAGLTWRAWRKLSALEAAAEYSKPLPSSLVNDTPEGAKPALDAFTAAIQAAAKAYEKYAAAITPDAPQSAIEEAYEDATDSTDAVQLAGLAWNVSKALAYRKASCAKYNNPDLDKKVQELERISNELLEAQRQQEGLKVRIRKLERAGGRADAEITELIQKLQAAPPSPPAPADN
jgi:hypothetical protein